MAAYYTCIGCRYYDTNEKDSSGRGICHKRRRYFAETDSCIDFKKGGNYHDTCFDCGYYLRYQVNRFGEGLCEKQEVHHPRSRAVCDCYRMRE